MVTFYFSAKSTAHVIIFWLLMADSFLSSATANLWCPSSQEWFLMHVWPFGLHIWGCAAGDTGSFKWPWVFRMKKGVDENFVFSLQFFWAACPDGNFYHQGALLTCLQHPQYADTADITLHDAAFHGSCLLASTISGPLSHEHDPMAEFPHWCSTSKSPHNFAIQHLGL